MMKPEQESGKKIVRIRVKTECLYLQDVQIINIPSHLQKLFLHKMFKTKVMKVRFTLQIYTKQDLKCHVTTGIIWM